MEFDFKFKSIQHSQSLVDYAIDRFSKLEKYELKPIMVHVTFSQERIHQVTQVYIKGMNSDFRATANGETFHEALDLCLKKLRKQMEKEKSKVKHHHHFEHSQEARITQLAKREQKNRDAS